MNNNSQILWEAYDEFLLPLGGKKVPSPYRRNDPFQPDRKKYGKSDPKSLAQDTIALAKEQNFDLNKASVDEIRQFMKENWLGIDCSGFAYWVIDYLLQRIDHDGMEKIDFPPASRTNVALLTSDLFSVPIKDLSLAQPGDLIKFNSEEDILHCLIVLDHQGDIVTYAHSSNETNPNGVHTGQIQNGQLPDDLKLFSYNPDKGDGVRRLKALA